MTPHVRQNLLPYPDTWLSIVPWPSTPSSVNTKAGTSNAYQLREPNHVTYQRWLNSQYNTRPTPPQTYFRMLDRSSKHSLPTSIHLLLPITTASCLNIRCAFLENEVMRLISYIPIDQNELGNLFILLGSNMMKKRGHIS